MDKRYLQKTEGLLDDHRLTAFRAGQAAAHLKGSVEAETFVDGELCHVTVPVSVLKREPGEEAAPDTQLLYGEDFMVFGEEGDWCWGQAVGDDYVGWVRRAHLTKGGAEADHWVMSRGTFVYVEPDIKSRPKMKIPMAARLTVMEETSRGETKFFKAPVGWVIARHVRGIEETARDFVSVAESMIGLTYLWAGRSTFGIDCSGFIQLSMQMAGIATLRDSDMQEKTIGEPVDLTDDLSGLQRGDLIFWQGHVGVMRDEKTLLHANGHTMSVFSEPLAKAVERIAYLYEKPRSIRRPFALSA